MKLLPDMPENITIQLDDGDKLRCRGPEGSLTSEIRRWIEEHRERLVACLKLLKSAESGKTDLDVYDLDEAMFLFAVGMIRSAADRATVWEQYSPFWAKRLPPDAFALLVQVYGEQAGIPTEHGPECGFQDRPPIQTLLTERREAPWCAH